MPQGLACCAYLRKSREDEEREKHGYGDTLERHEKIVRRLASDNGHEIERWYREVVSGETIAGRPQMTQLLRDVASGRWGAVYVVEASRLGRGGGADQEKIINALRYTGTWLVAEFKAYDPGSPADMRQLKGELRSSEDELESITARMNRGRYESAREGRWQATGRVPYGWRAVRIRGVWQLEPEPDTHPVMLRIYDMREAGDGWATIAKAFDAEGIPTARGGRRWTPAAVQAIAYNVANAGYVRFGVHKTVREFDPETFEVRKRKVKNDEAGVYKGLHYGKGGISLERFERITGRKVGEAHVRENRELRNPLAGILVCGKCGYAMDYHLMGSGGKPTYFYVHKRERACAERCVVRGARADQVLEAVCDALSSAARDVELRISGSGLEDAGYIAHVAALEESKRRAEGVRERVMQAFEQGAYSVEEMMERKGAAERTIRKAESELAQMRPPEYTPDTVIGLRRCIETLKDDTLPARAKNDFLKRFVKRIKYSNDTPKYVLPNDFGLEISLW